MSSGFDTDAPLISPYAKGEWVMRQAIGYTSLDGARYEIPAWFVSDGASIPWIVAPIFRGIEDRLPGYMHDWLWCSQRYPKAVCDALLFEMLIRNGCDQARAGLIHKAVTYFGGSRWKACKGGPKVEDFAFELMADADRVGVSQWIFQQGVAI